MEASKNSRMRATYQAWTEMINHAELRGIPVSEEFGRFDTFWIAMGPRPERFSMVMSDEEKGYCAETCCWSPDSS